MIFLSKVFSKAAWFDLVILPNGQSMQKLFLKSEAEWKIKAIKKWTEWKTRQIDKERLGEKVEPFWKVGLSEKTKWKKKEDIYHRILAYRAPSGANKVTEYIKHWLCTICHVNDLPVWTSLLKFFHILAKLIRKTYVGSRGTETELQQTLPNFSRSTLACNSSIEYGAKTFRWNRNSVVSLENVQTVPSERSWMK